MRKALCLRLALTNCKKNVRLYLPYLLACIGTVALFYNMCFLLMHKSTARPELQMILRFGVIVIGVFSLILLFYTNSFLLKRRTKEFGLLNVLGLEKRHIARIMLWEHTMIAAAALLGGFAVGILLCKGMTLLLFQILHFNVDYGFMVSGRALAITALVFLVIFFLTLVSSLLRVRRATAVSLLQGGNVGEREPKSKWLLALLGILLLSGGYAIALGVEDPIAALPAFFGAVLLVIFGTYCLFTAGSIVLLKALRKNKRYYYKTKHFTAVSGMLYRMKQNAVGLANICILSTIVLVTVSSTVCLYLGLGDALNTRFAADVQVSRYYVPGEAPNREELLRDIEAVTLQQKRTALSRSDCAYLSFSAVQEDSAFVPYQENIFSAHIDRFCFITAADYARMTGQTVSLAPNELLINSTNKQLPSGEYTIFGMPFSLSAAPTAPPDIGNYSHLLNLHYAVVADESVLDALYRLQKEAYGEEASPLAYEITVTLDGTFTEKCDFGTALMSAMERKNADGSTFYIGEVKSKQLSAANFYTVYGGLFFLGIFLGLMFLAATVLIMYYKQISEGYDDRARFAIMQKVGMSRAEIRRTVRTQVLTVFFLPLAAAGVHIAAAFRMITHLLSLFNMINVSLFVRCCIGTFLVFALIYTAVYALTARTYYKIVE